jgi:Rps23 Pro-64 3,4-dihydroxylase Tpa1-like proline 4-hydroxylase
MTNETIPAFFFSKKEMREKAETQRAMFENAAPFRHIHIENFLPEDVARQVAAAFPPPTAPMWNMAGPGDAKHSHDPNVEKISCPDEDRFPPVIRHVVGELASGVMMDYLERLTGIKNLTPDPSLFGGGMHSTGRGGRLMIHADASRHPNPMLHQVINLIYYCTPDWQEEWGGDLELWDKDCKHCEVKAKPKFNSAVIFYTGTNCYHGHPHPLTTPPGIRRNSIAVYYYTTDRQVGDDYDGHRTFVEWKRTTDHDRDLSAAHVAKEALRRYAPRDVVNAAARFVRWGRSKIS